MSFRLYVGNYPCNFTLENINNIFCDFDVTVEKMIQKNEKKSFCFVTCKDMEEAISVIQNLNGTSVSGRKLIIRACEQSLQDYINVLLLECNDGEDHNNKQKSPTPLQNTSASTSHPKFKERHDGQFEKKSCYSSRSSHINYKKCDEDESPKNKSCFASRLPLDSYQQNNESDVDKSVAKDSYSSSRVSHNSHNQKHKNNATELLAVGSYSSPNSSQTSLDQERKKFNNDESFENNSCSSRVPHQDYLRKYEEDTNESLEKDSYYSAGSSLNSYHQKFENNQRPSKSSKKFYPSRYEKNTFKQFENNRPYSSNTYQRKHENHSEEHFDKSFSHSPNFSEFTPHQVSKKYENNSKECFQESSYHSSQYNYDDDHHDSDGEISPRSKYTQNLLEQQDENIATWLSVTNFPFGTGVSEICELFSDYDPIEVEMICNFPTRGMLTEALVCFWNQDIANDVMMNFDNTIFHGRVILVNDIEDLTIINELLGGATRA